MVCSACGHAGDQTSFPGDSRKEEITFCLIRGYVYRKLFFPAKAPDPIVDLCDTRCRDDQVRIIQIIRLKRPLMYDDADFQSQGLQFGTEVRRNHGDPLYKIQENQNASGGNPSASDDGDSFFRQIKE